MRTDRGTAPDAPSSTERSIAVARDGEASPTARAIHVFVYGTLRDRAEAAGMLGECERLRPAEIDGMLFDIGAYPALVLAGRGRVSGEIWRCRPDLLPRLDAYERVADGLFRRVGISVEGIPCWTYVAGAALAPRLSPDRRIESGEWRATRMS